MIQGLERFVTELRREGIAVSPAEWLEGLRAVGIVGLADRDRFRHALRCALVKRAWQQPRFDKVFDAFFVRPGRGAGKRRRSDGRPGASSPGRLPGEGDRGRVPRAEPSEPLERKPPQLSHAPLGARALRQLVQEAREGSPSRRGRLRRVIVEDRLPRAASAASRPAARGEDLERDPLLCDLHRAMSLEEERQVAAQLPRIVERIRLRTGRRLRRSQRGRLNLRDAFRENLRYGGVPWKLPRRRIEPRRSKVVMLIDVSWSTARAAGLFLSMAGELMSRVAGTRILLFVDKAVDATDPIERWLERRATYPALSEPLGKRARPAAAVVRGGVSFAGILDSLNGLNLEASSDYGRMLHGLLRSRLRPVGRDTVLLVLGDGRSNRFDPQAWAFEEIAERCGAVLWLVPEGLERWGTADSALGSYLVHADVAVEARDLVGLARGVGELLRRL